MVGACGESLQVFAAICRRLVPALPDPATPDAAPRRPGALALARAAWDSGVIGSRAALTLYRATPPARATAASRHATPHHTVGRPTPQQDGGWREATRKLPRC